MKYLQSFDLELLETIGWTIIHSWWQALVILVILKFLFLILKMGNSNSRYLIGMLSLATVFLISCITFIKQHNKSNHITQTEANTPKTNISTGTEQLLLAAKPGIYNISHNNNRIVDRINPITPYLTVAWLVGILFFSFKILREGFILNSLRNISSYPKPDLQYILERIKSKMKLSKNVSLIITDRVSTPLTYGYFKPLILLPLEYIMQVPRDEVEMILAHELAHIKRNDYLINSFQIILETIYFLNPFFLLISKIVRNEREYCCDEMGSKVGGDRKQMAFALTKLNWLAHHKALGLSAAPLKSTFSDRVFRLLYPDNKSPYSLQKTFLSIFLLFLFTTILTNCIKSGAGKLDLPSNDDLVEQLYTDNQANHKVQVWGFNKLGKSHDIILISTIEGKPLYAYIDGNILNNSQLKELTNVVTKRKTISSEELKNIPQSAREVRNHNLTKLNHELDSIAADIKLVKKKVNSSLSDTQKINALNEALRLKQEQIVKLSMDAYEEDVKTTDLDVQLHEILNSIITRKEYTSEQRLELMRLINQRNSRI